MEKVFVLILALLTVLISQAQTVEQADSLHQRGRELMNEGNIAEGRECTRQAMEIRKKLLGEISEDYIMSLNNYALTFGKVGDYKNAMELQGKVMMLCGKLKTPHKNIGMYATNMGLYLYRTGDKQGAVRYWEQALPLVEKYGANYEFLLNSLWSFYDDLGDKQGMARIMGLMEEHNQHELTKPCDEPKCMLERAQYYATTGDNAQAKAHFLKLMAMPMKGDMKVAAHEGYAKFLGQMKDYTSAAENELAAANTQRDIDGTTERYANLMYISGLYSYLAKQYQQSVNCYKPVLDFYGQHDSKSARMNEAKCWKGMGNAYSALKNYQDAKNCYQKVVSIYETHDKDNAEYPKAILRVAKAEKFNKEYEASIISHQRAMQLFEQRGMTEDYADAANSLQLCYAYAGKSGEVKRDDKAEKASLYEKLDRMIKEEKESLEMTRQYLGKLVYARSLATIAGCHYKKAELQDAIAYYKMYIPAVRDAIRDEFRMQNETERMATWKEESSTVDEMEEMIILTENTDESTKSDFAALAYDAELLSKGILLNSAIEFEKVLQTRNDRALLEIYKKTKENEAEIERLRKKATIDVDSTKILSLTQRNQELQLELYRGCAEFADFTDYISYSWQDVRKALRESDIAIEFAAISTGSFDSDNYIVALILTEGAAAPVMERICNFSEAKMIGLNDADNPVWGKLSKHLAGKRRIFFAADGSFNSLAIEYLQYNSKPLSEQFEVYRLSSTKELCYKHQKTAYQYVALFGDINYNEDAVSTTASQRSVAALRGSADMEGGSLANLENTRLEVKEIQALLRGNDIKQVSMFTDTEASKEAFQQLSDSKVNILHVATHGIYKDQKKATDAESMQNSMLAFAGANLNNEHGWMTAEAISKMNLRQCDLAVLSACETGLGKLGGDGVFGLQRGFKKAGVHTLLMSLKNVYDESTAKLMIEFYQNLTNGMNKREALVKAQQDLRKQGYSDSKYWATFILLDALN